MDFLDQIYLDNTIRSYVFVLVSILVVLIFKKILSRYIASILFFFIHNAWKNIEKNQFNLLVVRPLGWLIVVIVSVFAFDELVFPYDWRFTIYRYPVKLLVEKIGICLIIISFIRFVLSGVDFIALILEQKALATKDKKDDQLIVFFRDLLKVLITLAGILLLIKAGFNQNIGSLLTGLSIVGAALALAAKESLENLIASIIIYFDKPFYVGDTLKVNNVTGEVERIGLRSTRIRTFDKTLVTVPNKQMVDSIVDNYSMRSERRAELKLEFSLKTTSADIELISDKIKRMLQANPDVVSHSVFFSEINKNGLTVTAEYFTIPFSMNEFNNLKQSIVLFLKNSIDELKIDMASSAPDIIIQGDTGPVPPPAKTII